MFTLRNLIRCSLILAIMVLPPTAGCRPHLLDGTAVAAVASDTSPT